MGEDEMTHAPSCAHEWTESGGWTRHWSLEFNCIVYWVLVFKFVFKVNALEGKFFKEEALLKCVGHAAALDRGSEEH